MPGKTKRACRHTADPIQNLEVIATFFAWNAVHVLRGMLLT